MCERGITHFVLIQISDDSLNLKFICKRLIELFKTLRNCDRFSVVLFGENVFFKLKPRPVSELKRNNEIPNLFNNITCIKQKTMDVQKAINYVIKGIRNKENGENCISVYTNKRGIVSKMEELEKSIETYQNMWINIMLVK